MKRHHDHIDAGLLYEQLGGKIREAVEYAKRSHRRVNSVYENNHFPEDLRHEQMLARAMAHTTLISLSEALELLTILQTSAGIKKQAVVMPDRKRIERMTVVRGGLYTSPVKKPRKEELPLSYEFRSFLEKERAGTEETNRTS